MIICGKCTKNLGETEISLSLPSQMGNHRFGAIAQLVEQRTENPCVPGSIPGGTTKKQLQRCGCFFVCCNEIGSQNGEK